MLLYRKEEENPFCLFVCLFVRSFVCSGFLYFSFLLKVNQLGSYFNSIYYCIWAILRDQSQIVYDLNLIN